MTLQGTWGQSPGKSELPEGHSLEAGEPHVVGEAWLPPPSCDGWYAAGRSQISQGQPEWEASAFLHPLMPQGMALTLANLREDPAPSGKEGTAPPPRPLAWVGHGFFPFVNQAVDSVGASLDTLTL